MSVVTTAVDTVHLKKKQHDKYDSITELIKTDVVKRNSLLMFQTQTVDCPGLLTAHKVIRSKYRK